MIGNVSVALPNWVKCLMLVILILSKQNSLETRTPFVNSYFSIQERITRGNVLWQILAKSMKKIYQVAQKV